MADTATGTFTSTTIPECRFPFKLPARGFFRLPLSRMVLPALLVFVCNDSALAQFNALAPAPDDAYLRQQERERARREQQQRGADVHLPAAPDSGALTRLPEGEENCFRIGRIVLAGDAAGDFQWALAYAHQLEDGSVDRATGRCLGTQGINLLMRRLQNAIVARGYVTARVLAGRQDSLAAGELVLTLYPGHIGAIRFAPGTDSRATLWNALPMRDGELLNLRQLEQALENFKRVPGVEADIEIVPAQEPASMPGYSDLVIHWQQAFPLRLSFSADDSGTRATGRYQANVTASLDHALTLNDLFYIGLNHNAAGGALGPRGAHGTRGYTVHYSLPFGDWLLGLTSSRNQYHQTVAGASQDYLYSGESRNNEIQLSRMVYRNASGKSTLSLRGWSRASRNFIDDTEIEVQRRRMAGYDLGLSHREFIAAATLDASLNYRRGTGAHDALRAPEESFGEGTSRPRIFSTDGQLNLPFRLGQQFWRYTGAWRAQWNKTPLVPQDRFLIGGRYTVRGFDGESQLLAERGWLLRNDIGWTLGATAQELYLGVDYGRVGGRSVQFLAGDHLSGAVIGWRGALKKLSYDVFLGSPLSRPAGFDTARVTAGFMVNWSP